VERTRPPVNDQAPNGPCEVVRKRRVAALIGNKRQVLVFTSKPKNRLHHVVPESSAQPGCAHNRGSGVEFPFPTKLGLPVHRLRIGVIPLNVRIQFGSIEHVIGGYIADMCTDASSRLSDMTSPERVDAQGTVGIALACIDGGPSTRVDDRGGSLGSHESEHGFPICDVECGVINAKDLMVRERIEEFASQLPSRSGHKNMH